MVSFLTGSLGEFLDRNFESDDVKALYLANNVYGKHGGPYQPGTAIGLLFHLLSGGEHDLQGFYGHVIGGMGADHRRRWPTPAESTASRSGRLHPSHASLVRDGEARGVVLEDGTEIGAKRRPLERRPQANLPRTRRPEGLPEDFRAAVSGIKMDGPSAKVNLVLGEEPERHRHAR